MKVSFHRPTVSSRALHLVADCVNADWITSGGMTERLEAMVRELTGARHAIAVNSATTGMMLVAKWFGPNVNVPRCSVPALGGHFAANAMVLAGFKYVDLIDCDASDLCTHFCSGDFHVTMDYGGRACDASPPCYRFRLCDSAYSLGGIGRDGKPIGTQADAHVFSLQATKQITCGEGGIVTTEIDELAVWLKRARCHGMDADAHTRTGHGYDIVQPGGAFMLPDILAAVAVSQMETAEERRQKRLDIRLEYERAVPKRSVKSGMDDAHGLHVLRIPGTGDGKICSNRDGFIRLMENRGVACKVHYPAIYSLTAWKHLERGDSPNAEKAAAEVVSLPLFSDLRDEEVEYVCKSAKETLAELEE